MANKMQTKIWQEAFGRDYTKRNLFSAKQLDELYKQRYGVKRSEMNKEFLQYLNRNILVLEVGCNAGQQLKQLEIMGFKNLYGIDVQKYAIQLAKKNLRNTKLLCGSALKLPFADNFFDLVFTSGVLIHINPKNIKGVVKEIFRCTRKYIWGFEYHSPKGYQNIIYKGHKNLLWKTDFRKIYTRFFPDLILIKEKKYRYLDNNRLIDQMFLLKKTRL